MNTEHRGSCLCNAVRFITRGPLQDVVACHCSQCRKQSGHHYAATRVDDTQLEIQGAEHLRWYQASEHARRGFCGTCGSAMFWKRLHADSTSILAGSFDAPTGMKLTHHIFVADKGDYYELGDDLPCFPAAD